MSDTAGWEQQVVANAAKYQRLHDRLTHVAITETSADGSVKVTIDTNGLLTGLELVDRGAPFAELAKQVMRCLGRAQARIPDLLAQAVSDELGQPDAGAHLLLADTRKRFPELTQEQQPRQPAGPPRAGDREDWDEQPILHDI